MGCDHHSSYWGHVMPGLGTPKVKIQVIDLEHLIGSRGARMQWERLDRVQARANAMGTVPIACARAWTLSSILERA